MCFTYLSFEWSAIFDCFHFLNCSIYRVHFIISMSDNIILSTVFNYYLIRHILFENGFEPYHSPQNFHWIGLKQQIFTYLFEKDVIKILFQHFAGIYTVFNIQLQQLFYFCIMVPNGIFNSIANRFYYSLAFPFSLCLNWYVKVESTGPYEYEHT